LKKIKFLITGGAGFIGSNLAERLLKDGHYVRILDNFFTGKKDNIKEFTDNNNNFELIEGDIRDLDICQKACANIDYVLHQAAIGSVPRSIDDPISSFEVNINGTLNMLMAARDNKVKRFVYASSSSVYGDNNDNVKTEGREGKLLSPYAITKDTDEKISQNFYEIFGLETVGLRYFNIFGPKQDEQSYYAAVIPIFISRILEDKNPVINGDGNISRDFTYVGNAVEANIKACFSSPEVCSKVFNVGCGGNITLDQLVGEINKITGKNIEPEYGPPRPGDIKQSCADISFTKKMLDYEPVTSFEEGLKLTVDWYKKYKKL